MDKNQAYDNWKKDPLHPTDEACLMFDEVPILYAINTGGMYGFDTKTPVYAITEDPLKVPRCVLCLCRWLDGSPVAIRYFGRDVRMVETRTEYNGIRYLHYSYLNRK
jgi:hypothetical protein